MRRETLLDVFTDIARFPEEFIVYEDGYRIHRHSYRETADAARRFAARLSDAGIIKGDKVLFWGENRPEWLVALWGCLLQGAIVVPVDYRASSELLTRVQSVAQTKLLLRGEETGEQPLRDLPVWKFSSIEWQAPPAGFAPVQIDRDDIAEILFTSGATAEPKGVLIRHRNILANIVPVEREIGKYRKYQKPFAPIRFLNLLPLSHMFGQAMATFIPPMLPGVVVFMRGYHPHDIVRQIHNRRISVLVCVPKILEVLREYVLRVVPEAAELPPANSHWLSRWWRYRRVHRLFGWKFWALIVGAAPLDPELEEFWGRLGYVVVQGYGLTETAPIVSLNHPFHTRKGTVGKPIAGVEVKIADDGEILVRGDNVTSGYLNPSAETGDVFENGWFHTGDIGSMDEAGRLYVRGRKKEMIVTPEGLNVFPEDIERALNQTPGVQDSAVVRMQRGAEERPHAVLVLDAGADPHAIVREANSRLEDHQKVRGFSVWPTSELPRTEGTRKLKRREVQQWVEGGGSPVQPRADGERTVGSVVAEFAPGRALTPQTSLQELGLSSLERVELLMALERRLDVVLDETAYAQCLTISDLQSLASQSADLPAGAVASISGEPVDFPTWSRSRWADINRRINLPAWILPLARLFLWVRVEGLENLDGMEPPIIFAPNHQSHMDIPALMLALPPKWRYRLATAMSKEFFDAHFHPRQHTWREWLTNSLNYYLAALYFNAFPIPQRETGVRQTLRYTGELAGEGWCIVIFPEGRISNTEEVDRFLPGVGMMGSRLNLPVVPVRLRGVNQVLRKGWRMARPGRVQVKIGRPLTLAGEDYAALAGQVEEAVRRL